MSNNKKYMYPASRTVSVRIQMVTERYQVAASLFDTVFCRANGLDDAPNELKEVSPEEEIRMGILEDMDSDGGFFVKPAELSVLRTLQKRRDAEGGRKHTDEEDGLERLHLYSEGIMTFVPDPDGKSETVTIAYDETELTGLEGSHTEITFRTADAGLVNLVRGGTITTSMTFRAHSRAICVYETPYMPFHVGIHCLTVDNRLTEDGNRYLRLDYILEIRGARAERCRMEMRLLD